VTTGEAFDSTAFLAAAARDGGEGAVALFQRLFEGARTAGMHIDPGAGATPAVVGWCVLDGVPSIAWVAMTRGASGVPCVEVFVADLYARAAVPPFDEVVQALHAIPVVRHSLDAAHAAGVSVRSVTVEVADLVADAEQAAQLLDVFDRLAAASAGTYATFRSVIGAYEWGERGEHGS